MEKTAVVLSRSAVPRMDGNISRPARSLRTASCTSYGQTFRDRVQAMSIEKVVTAPRSPWQNAYVERIIGSIRRECLDHVIIFDERHLRRVLLAYFQYHHQSRTHLSLSKDCPEPRPIQPPSAGTIVAFPQVGGLHHRYERRAA